MTWAVFSPEHRLAIEEIKSSNSERIVTIVGGAILDNTLRRTLSERLINDKSTVQKLLKVGGPLGNTQPKAEMLFLLGGLDEQTKNTVIALTEIRNFFAHHLAATFDSEDERVTKPFERLTLHAGRAYYPHHFFKNKDTVTPIELPRSKRDIFILNLKLCLLAMMQDRVSHHTHTNTPRTPEEIQTAFDATQINRRPPPIVREAST